MNAMVPLKHPRSLNPLPRARNLNQHPLLLDALFLIQANQPQRLGNRRRNVEAELGVHFRRHSTWNQRQDLGSKVDELRILTNIKNLKPGILNKVGFYQAVNGPSELLFGIPSTLFPVSNRIRNQRCVRHLLRCRQNQ